MSRLQSGKIGELAAERFFADNGWHMTRTQPEITILSMVTVPMVMALKRFIPRLAAFGYMVLARLHRGGVPDFTGFRIIENSSVVEENGIAEYRACEVKEAQGTTMPASRLAREQRAFMAALPAGCAWVGVFWQDTQKFEIYPFIEKGSYKRNV